MCQGYFFHSHWILQCAALSLPVSSKIGRVPSPYSIGISLSLTTQHTRTTNYCPPFFLSPPTRGGSEVYIYDTHLATHKSNQAPYSLSISLFFSWELQWRWPWSFLLCSCSSVFVLLCCDGMKFDTARKGCLLVQWAGLFLGKPLSFSSKDQTLWNPKELGTDFSVFWLWIYGFLGFSFNIALFFVFEKVWEHFQVPYFRVSYDCLYGSRG